jgi:hypothetical protein
VDNQGIPPDGLRRTAWGAYPVGGRFDSQSNEGVNATTRGGMYGAGIQPIITRSFVQFMLAEAKLYLPLVDATTARTRFTNGINYSFTDVRDYVVNGTYGIGTATSTEANTGTGTGAGQSPSINNYYTAANYTADVATYVTRAQTDYDARFAISADNAMNLVAREYWVSLFGCGVEAYNLYRRTQMPTGLQPTIQPNPGVYPKSFWYPNNFATLNSNAPGTNNGQKADLNQRVFWDGNSGTNLDF